VYYISNVTATNAMQTSGNGGNAWSNFAGTADAHLHQFNGNDTFYYFVQACDNSTPANCTNSTVRSDLMQLGGMPPTAPFVYSPAFNSTYLNNSLININYTESISPNAYNISYYNITLRNANLSFNKTIYANNSQNLSYVWDSTGTPASEYVIGVEAKDQNNQTTVGYSGEFTLVAVSTCGTITTDTTLNSNLTSSGTCITIGASHITLDCNGYSLTGDGTLRGIYSNNFHAVTIANCYVYHYYQGIYLNTFTSGFVFNVTSNNNHFDGLLTEDYSGSNVMDNVTLNNNGNYGGVNSYTDHASNFTNFVTNNNTNTGFCIRQGYNYGNELINFTSVNNSDSGLVLDNSPNTIIVNMNASGNKVNGAYVAVGSSIVYLNDSVFHNNSVGIRYLTSNGMKANNLTISNSSTYGLSFYYTSTTLTLSNSSIINSGVYDLFFEETPTGKHILLNTTFNSSKIGYYHCNANCNFTSQLYARINVTNATDALSASVNDTDAQGNKAYSATLGADGLSPWFIVNDTLYSGAGNTAFNPHSINASYTGYAINMSQYNFTGRDYTFNVTLYEPITITFIPPTPNNGGIVYGHNVSFAIVSSGALTNASLMFDGVSYWMFQSTPTLWTLGLGGVPYGNYYFNATGSVQSSVNVTSNTRVISLQEYQKGTFTMNNSLPIYSTTMSIVGNATLVNYTGFTINMTCTNPLGGITPLTVTGGPLIYQGNYIATYMGNYTCWGSAINDTYDLHNSTSFEVFCPAGFTVVIANRCYLPLTAVGLNATTVQKYVDLGDYFYLKVALQRNITFNSMYAYSADGTPIAFTYATAGEYWYVGYQVRQKSEEVVIQTFDVTGTANGYGTYVISYNPKPASTWWLSSISAFGAYGAITIALIIVIIAIIMIYSASKSYTRQPAQITPQLKPSHGGAIGRTFGTAHLIVGIGLLVAAVVVLAILYLLLTWVLRAFGIL